MESGAQNLTEVEGKLLEIISPEYMSSLIKFLGIIRKLDELGVLDTLNDLLEPEVVGELMSTLITTNSTYLMSNMDDAMGAMAKLLDAFREASNAAANDNRSVILLLTELLTDEDAKRGLRFLNALLRSLGRRLR
ncbi:DUF1641 domain-containing protein [Vulcanisaeta thermophila]|uniref:DUF1641 domain-containing protein n=1 Tax=Vulcanisaeta thermophila TaxID=867917 RepID=UPI0009FEA4B8|nr:DUF1641 domain-containing protein [Vulcanisaeta thermophila]